MKKKSVFLVVVNTLGFIWTIIINGLANTLPLNGRSTGEISDLYPNLFVPANITFAIWGLIYFLLTAFIVYSIFAILKKGNNISFIRRIGPWFLISSSINSLWILAWHWELIPLTLLFMGMLLASLIKIYRELKIGTQAKISPARRFFVHLPFSVYLGWITVASIANVTALLVSYGWNGIPLSESFWAGLVIVVAVIITGLMIIRHKDIGYALVIIWALFGIWLKRSMADTVGSLAPDTSVGIIAIIGIAILFLMLIVVPIASLRKKSS